jgi:hypothetical protein|mmetsp:Transcript_16921/g.30652  ORF Transcript_16921/g.30652 Transcript_16921/m.30652 type:complete len:138 (+) Transcript_16921:143-556(+)
MVLVLTFKERQPWAAAAQLHHHLKSSMKAGDRFSYPKKESPGRITRFHGCHDRVRVCFNSCSGGTVVNVPFTDKRLSQMQMSVDEAAKTMPILVIKWDASLFESTWSGSMTLKIKTKQAQEFLNIIQAPIQKVQVSQ